MSKISQKNGELLITVYDGEDFAPTLTYKVDGVAQDITGYTMTANLKQRRSDSTAAATFDCSIVDAANGIFNFKLSRSDISGLAASHYYFDLFANDGLLTYHWMTGRLEKKEAA